MKCLVVPKKYFTIFNLIFLVANAVLALLFVRPQRASDASAANESVFEFAVKSDVFQFDESRATDAQKAINKKLSDAKIRYLREFEADFAEFLSESETETVRYCPSLEIKTMVRINSPELFSVRMNVIPWHQGTCGNPTEVETFNFALDGNEIRELTLSDVVPNESERIELLWRAFKKNPRRIARQTFCGHNETRLQRKLPRRRRLFKTYKIHHCRKRNGNNLSVGTADKSRRRAIVGICRNL